MLTIQIGGDLSRDGRHNDPAHQFDVFRRNSSAGSTRLGSHHRSHGAWSLFVGICHHLSFVPTPRPTSSAKQFVGPTSEANHRVGSCRHEDNPSASKGPDFLAPRCVKPSCPEVVPPGARNVLRWENPTWNARNVVQMIRAWSFTRRQVWGAEWELNLPKGRFRRQF